MTHSFILNGLLHANRLLGGDAFNLEDWQVIGEYDEVNGRHHACVAPCKDATIDGVVIKAGERVHFEQSFKYSVRETEVLWGTTGFVEGTQWNNQNGKYG